MTTYKAKQLIIHLGLAKTGSSSLQRVFYEQRNTLLERYGVLYLSFQENHSYLAAMFAEEPELLPQMQSLGLSGRPEFDAFFQNLSNKILHEVAATKPNRIIVSSEYFSAMSVSELRSLYSFLKSIAEDILPFAYLRDPWSFTTSIVQEMIRSGSLSNEIYFGYAQSNIEILNKFEEAFETSVTVIPYCGGKQSKDVITDFANRIGISIEQDFGVAKSQRVLNVAMSREAASVMLHLNRHYPINSPTKDWIVEVLQEAYDKSTRLTISRATAERIYREAKSDLDIIESKYFSGQAIFTEHYENSNFDNFDDALTLSSFSPTHLVEYMLNALDKLSSRALYYHSHMILNNAERLYWNGKYLTQIGEIECAKEAFIEALNYQPNNEKIISELALINALNLNNGLNANVNKAAKKITRKILIIGASGYIGKELFNEANKMVDTIGTSTHSSESTIAFDLSAPNCFDYDLVKKDDIVIFAAAISSPDICANNESRARQINVVGTIKFIEKIVARGGRVIFFSSDVVYGETSSLVDESATCHPAGKYAMMKHEVERYFSNEYLFKSIRLSYVFSKDDKFTSYLLDCMNKQKVAEIFHPLCRSVIHIADVIDGVLALARDWELFPQRVMNFGGPELLSRVDIARSLQRAVFTKLQYNQVTPDDAFFLNRPKVIAMSSPILHKLLRRPATNLAKAARIEFNN